MKKLLLAIAIICSVALFTGCGGGAGNPKDALVAFFDAMGKKDMEAARKLATADSKSMLDMMEMGLKMDKGESKKDDFDKANMEFGEAKIDGDKATVAVKNKKKNDEVVNFNLKKEEGKWKVAFDKSSIMQMATDQMGKDGGMDKALEKLKDVNMDSLKENINKSMEALDSAKKELEKIKTD